MDYQTLFMWGLVIIDLSTIWLLYQKHLEVDELHEDMQALRRRMRYEHEIYDYLKKGKRRAPMIELLPLKTNDYQETGEAWLDDICELPRIIKLKDRTGVSVKEVELGPATPVN